MSALTLKQHYSKNETEAKRNAEVDQYLSFQFGGETFALGILCIREILEYEYFTEVPLMPDFIRGVMNLRGSVVPVIDLALRFQREKTILGRRSCIIIVEVYKDGDTQQHLMGILVDAVNEVLSIASHEIEPPPQFGSRVRTEFISGMARVEHKFIILLNADKVLSVEEMTLLSTFDVPQIVDVNGSMNAAY